MNLRLVRHATLLLKLGGKSILVDPILAPKGSAEPVKGVANQNWNPLVDIPFPAELLTSCDAVLVSHTHRDHFDEAAASLLPKGVQMFCQPQDGEKLMKYGFKNVTPIDKEVEWNGITITRTPAQHGHGITALKMAPVSGFVVRTPGEPSVYIAGDSVFYCETEKVLKRYNPEIIICNAGEATWDGTPITMGIKDIALLHSVSPEAKIVTVHMEAWNHCVLSREVLGKYIAEAGLAGSILIPADGEELIFSSDGSI